MSDVKQKAEKLMKSGLSKASKGKYKDALKDYLGAVKLNDSPNIHIKIGDCYTKVDKKTEAKKHYSIAAAKFDNEGILIKAIAANKMILRLDPDDAGAKERISALHNKQSGNDGSTGLLPKGATAEKNDTPISDESEMKSFLYDSDSLESEFSLSKKQELASYSEKEKEIGISKDIEIFSGLSHDEFVAVVDKIEPITFSAGEVIVREGDEGDSIYIIVSGEVSIFRNTEFGEEIHITDLSDGAFFGEFGFFLKSKRFATIKAAVETTLLELKKRDMDNLTKEHPQVREVLIKFYKNRVLDTILATSPLFSCLSSESRGAIVQLFKLKRFKKGAVIIKQGSPADSMFLIKSGVVKVVSKVEGEDDFISRLFSGDYFGEVALFTGKPRMAEVIAESDSDLMEIRKNDLKIVVKDHPKVLETLKENIQSRMKKT